MWLNAHLHQYGGAHRHNGWKGTQISQLDMSPCPIPPIKASVPWAGGTPVTLTELRRMSADHFTDWIIESQNHRLKWPLRSLSPTICPTTPCLLNHILKCHIYTFFKHLQQWGLNHIPGQPVPMSDHSFSKEIFPNI